MSHKILFARSMSEVRRFDTTELRQNFLIEQVFVPDEVTCHYSMQDRFVVLGVAPVAQSVTLPAFEALTKADFFLQRRELGIINVGGAGRVSIDGVSYDLAPQDGLYVGKGAKNIVFESLSADNPALFYGNSCLAHTDYPVVHISKSEVEPLDMGDFSTANKRLIYQYIIPSRLQTCQLVMGFTILQPPSVWNTMPPHTHLRRNEVYFYFDIPDHQFVMHLMGEPHETRHLVVRNHQAVVSPEWSIHSGAGSASYAFIWGMAGENQDYTDMDKVDVLSLK